MNRIKGSEGRKGVVLKSLVHLAAAVPLLRLAWLGYQRELGANPIEFITRSTGTWTLTILVATLAITPLRRISGWQGLARHRRAIGLWAFFYGCLHLVTYLWLDQFFDWQGILRDIYKRPFITAGFGAFLMLLLPAATSSSWAIRRLGGRRWQRLHRLVYLAALLGVTHYWWLVKADITRPAIYAAVLGALLLARVILAFGNRPSRPQHGSSRSS